MLLDSVKCCCCVWHRVSSKAKQNIAMIILIFALLVSVSESSVAGTLIASRIRALQEELHGGKLQTPPLATLLNSTIQKIANKPNEQMKSLKKPATGRYYPEMGQQLSVREMIAKESFRLLAQMLLDRMPSKRQDSGEWIVPAPVYGYSKKRDHHPPVQGRQFLESEEFILFLVGLGLASVLGMATMMAPLNHMMYSHAAYAPPAYPIHQGHPMFAPQHGRRRRSVRIRGHRREEDLQAIILQMERAARKYNSTRRRSSRLL